MQESFKAKAAYAAYEALGPERSLAKLGDKLGKSRGKTGANSQLEAWCSKYHWVERAKSYDAEQIERERALKEHAKAAEIKRRAARDARRQLARETSDDNKVAIFGPEWAKVLSNINARLDRDETHGLVGLVSLLNTALEEERKSLGVQPQQIEISGKDGAPLPGLTIITTALSSADDARYVQRGQRLVSEPDGDDV